MKWLIFFFVCLIGLILLGRRLHAQTATEKARRFHSSTLVSVLMSLDEDSLDELLELYKREFGAGPARYARQTFQKWKAGTVQPATQTYRRFLVQLPNVMSYDLKCEVLGHFMKEYSAKNTYELNVTTTDWEDKLRPLVIDIVDRAFNAQLPNELEDRLKWLGDGDMVAAQKILRSSQAKESELMVSNLREDVRSIDAMLLTEQSRKPRVTHTVEFPYGTIKINITRHNGKHGE